MLGWFFAADAPVLDPAVEYDQILGLHVLASVTRGLRKSQRLWEDGHWDEFITQINGVVESLIRRIFRMRYANMGLDQQSGERLASNAYTSMLNMTQFRTAYSKLQAHSNMIQSFRLDSPTAHTMNKDGTEKREATADEAEYVRSEFEAAFTEIVRVLG